MPFLLLFLLMTLTPLQAMPLVISSDDFDALQRKSTLVILDVQKLSDYQKHHIPGSQWVRWQDFTRNSGTPASPGYGELLDWPLLSQKIGQLGIDINSNVIVVGASNKGWGEEGYILWMLRAAGVKNSALLDGGIQYWKKQKMPMSQFSAKNQTKSFMAKPNLEWLMATEDLRNSYGNITVLDTRNWMEYKGLVLHKESRGGRIPQAKHLEYLSVFQKDGRLKSIPELETLFGQYLNDKSAPVVSYCSAGVRSAMLTIALRHAGYINAKNYDASMWGWSQDPDLPMDRF